MLPSLYLGTSVLYHIHTIITIVIIIIIITFTIIIIIIIIINNNEWDEQYLSQHEALNPTCPLHHQYLPMCTDPHHLLCLCGAEETLDGMGCVCSEGMTL
jgi:hypothetical protein